MEAIDFYIYFKICMKCSGSKVLFYHVLLDVITGLVEICHRNHG